MADPSNVNAPSETDDVQSAMLLTEKEWAVLRSIVCEFASSIGPSITEEEADLVDRIIEATDA